MGYRRGWGPDLNRSFRAGSKLADDITKGLLLGGLVGSSRFSSRTRATSSRPVRRNQSASSERNY